MVFLYGGFTTGKDKDIFTFHEGSKRIVHLGTPPQRLQDQAGQEVLEEHQRLLYVGMTRARAKLYLPHIAQTPPPDQRTSTDGPYNVLNRRIDDLRRTGEAPRSLFSWATAERLDREGRGAVAEEQGQTAALPAWQPDQAGPAMKASDGEIGRLRQEHGGFAITSYTRIKQKQDAAHDEGAEDRDTEQSDRPAVAAQPADRIAGPAFGSAIHAIMERIPFDSFSNGVSLEAWASQKQVQDICRESLNAEGIDEVHLSYARQLVYHTLTAPVSLGVDGIVPGLCSVQDLSRETQFLYPFPEAFHPSLDRPGRDLAIDRGYVKGYIDFLFRFGNKVYFLDWKTDILADYSRPEMEKHFQAHYEMQVKLYLLAMIKLMQCRSREAYDRDFGAILYCFMRGMEQAEPGTQGLLLIRPSWDDVLAWEQELVGSRGYI